MASAIPAAIGLGTSLIGGIQGKGAAKEERKLRERQLAQLQPLINAQTAGSIFGLDTARGLYPQAINAIQTIFNKSTGQFEPLVGNYNRLLERGLSGADELFGEGRKLFGTGGEMIGEGRGLLQSSLPYLTGAATALGDLQKFYRPFMFDGQRAIDRFLPSAQRTNQLLAPEFSNINQGFRSASENIARFAPRGGGRVSSLARADIDRQGQISNTFFQGRQGLADRALGAAFQGAAGEQNRANALQALGLGQGQLGLGQIGQGLNTIGTGANLFGTGISRLGTEGGLAQNAMNQALQALSLGGSAAGNLGNLASGALGMGLQGGQGIYNLYNNQANRSLVANQEDLFGTGKGFGAHLVDLFKEKSIQDTLTKGFKDLFNIGPATRPRTVMG